MSTLKTTNLQNADASSANIVLGQGSGGGATITGVTTVTTLKSATGTFTGNVDIADSIIHTGDTDTKLRFPSTDTVTVETGGTERLRITSTGQLQATGAADVRLTLGSSGTAGTNNSVHIRADGANLNFMAASGGGTKFEVNGTQTLNIGSSGLIIVGAADVGGRIDATAGDASIKILDGNGRSSIKVSDPGSGNAYTWELTSAGNFKAPSGKGINFSAYATSGNPSSNLLDDYEEGTFTPTATVEGESAASTDKNYGRYVKVGNKVTVWCYIQLNGTPSNRANNKAWQHGGLPFTHRNVASGFDVAGSMLHWTLDSNSGLSGTAPYTLVPRLFNNATSGRIRAIGSDANQTGVNASLLMKDNTEYAYTFTYETT